MRDLMETRTGSAGRPETQAARQRREIAEALVEAVREAIAKGEVPPWRKPWVAGLGSHRSGRKGSKANYKRWNGWATWLVASRRGYRSELWYTEAQGLKFGWTRKPDAGSASIIVPLMGRTADGEDQGLTFNNDWGSREVYNREGFDGPSPESPAEPWDDVAGVARVIALYRAVGTDLQIAGYAYFNSGDFDNDEHIGMPPAAHFESATAWAGTALHELAHWAGHGDRLARDKRYHTPYGRAFEELVAELGASMLAAQLRVAGTRVDDEQHRAYLTIWAARIQRDPGALQRALELADATVAFLADLAPAAFALDDDAGAAAIAEVPRVLRDRWVWRRSVRNCLVHEEMAGPIPPLVIGVDAAVAIGAWLRAAQDWLGEPGSDAPILLLAGAPGDGAETLLAWLRGFMLGDPPGGMLFVGANGGPVSLSIAEPGGRFEARRLPRHEADADELPAFDFPLQGTGDAGLSWAPSHPTDGRVVASLARGPRSAPMIVVGRHLNVADQQNTLRVFVVDLAAEPLAAMAARWRLEKVDPRQWVALEHRHPQTTRRLESWSNRLRSAQPWLDGRKHRVTDSLRRLRLRESSPFSPIVLQAAQAVLDALASTGTPTPGLPALLDDALSRHPLPSPACLIPLDVLASPIFGGPLRTLGLGERDGSTPGVEVTHARIRFVVQLLQLCPELSLGSKAIALMLQTSADQDVDMLATEVDRVGMNRATPTAGMGQLKRTSGSWSCDRACVSSR